jgi:hypothetical protein
LGSRVDLRRRGSCGDDNRRVFVETALESATENDDLFAHFADRLAVEARGSDALPGKTEAQVLMSEAEEVEAGKAARFDLEQTLVRDKEKRRGAVPKHNIDRRNVERAIPTHRVNKHSIGKELADEGHDLRST